MKKSTAAAEIQTIFDSVSETLYEKDWFHQGEWLTSTHLFPADCPEAMTFHVYKANWFNEGHQGIHIESFLNLDPKRRAKSGLTLHLLHSDKIPNTDIKRKELSMPVVDGLFNQISKWEGYKFRTGKYGAQPFVKDLLGTGVQFEKILGEEVTRLCKVVGPIVDAVLGDLLGHPQKIKKSPAKKSHK